jgi:hypothetical protein
MGSWWLAQCPHRTDSQTCGMSLHQRLQPISGVKGGGSHGICAEPLVLVADSWHSCGQVGDTG